MQFSRCDTTKPDGFYVQIVRVILPDGCEDRPDERDDGFWPSKDPNDAGYVLPENYKEEWNKANDRMIGWKLGHWQYVGVIARARCLVVRNGVGTFFNIDSPGLWGVESDADEGYLNELYAEETDELKAMLAAMHDPIYEEA